MSKQHWLALTSVAGIGGVTARKLLERFGSVEAIFAAPAGELTKVARVTDQMAEQLAAVSPDRFSKSLEALADGGIDVFTWDDDEYPVNLRSLNDAPPLLYVRGTVLVEDADAVAIVGSRDPRAESAELAEKLACELAERGLTVVSGLALGIDAAAHRGALGARRGRTLGVLGSGLARMFPPDNAELASQVAERGALLTELRPNVPATGPSLMARDRIVSGLSRAVIVVEAREQSGSMDTARRARSQERLLVAVPGSPGCNLLLSQGAVRLDPQNLDLDVLASRIRAHAGGADESQQLGLFG